MAKKKSVSASTRISCEIYEGTQSWNYVALHDCCGQRLRIHIKRDSADFQSYRRVEIFSTTEKKWNVLWQLPFESAHSKAICYVDKRPTLKVELFEKDEQELIAAAVRVLT